MIFEHFHHDQSEFYILEFAIILKTIKAVCAKEPHEK